MSITASTIIQTKFGAFKASYHKFGKSVCVSFSQGDITKNTPIVRMHSACLFAECFLSTHCDCGHQLTECIKAIAKSGCGVVVYSYKEGRGVGLENKIKSMEVARAEKCDTIEAFKKLGFNKLDYRTYKTEVLALKELKLSKTIILFSGNPNKRAALNEAGFKIIGHLETKNKGLSREAIMGKKAKKEKLGYNYKNIR